MDNTPQKALHQQFMEKYPVFQKFLPLAIGTREKLMEENPEISKSEIRKVLRLHCTRKHYLLKIIEGNNRYDVDGTENGNVSEKQERIAKLMVKGEYYKKKPKPAQPVKQEKAKAGTDKAAPKKKGVKPKPKPKPNIDTENIKGAKPHIQPATVAQNGKKPEVKSSKPIIKLKKKRRIVIPSKT